jgi:hypothetical protein
MDPGLCRTCACADPIETRRGSIFWRCQEHDRDPSWPKYPRLPVRACPRYRPTAPHDPGDPPT